MDRWLSLRRLTSARIGIGRAGASIPTAALLDFRFSHARARDAVSAPFDPEQLAGAIRSAGQEVLVLESRAPTRGVYLKRPDLGRRLSDASHDALLVLAESAPDLAIVVSDGLSTAAMVHVLPVLEELLPLCDQADWTVAPIFVVPNGRVAIQDEIGGLLSAKITLMFLGERPGLGSHDSLGAYFTYAPCPGRTDADRNCVSNIREAGLPPRLAAQRLAALLRESRRLGFSGFRLKDISSSGLPGGGSLPCPPHDSIPPDP